MTISERIFERLNEMHLSQKNFSEKTGIRQSTISEWKAKRTNPSSDKIMIICEVLEVSPEWLLSGAETKGTYRNQVDRFVIDRDSELGELLIEFNRMSSRDRARVQGYIDAMNEKKK